MLADEYLLEGQGERAHRHPADPRPDRHAQRDAGAGAWPAPAGLHRVRRQAGRSLRHAGRSGRHQLAGLAGQRAARRGPAVAPRRSRGGRRPVDGRRAGAGPGAGASEHIAGVLALSPAFRHDGWSMPRYTKLACLLPVMRALGIGRRSVFMEQPPYGIKDEALRARVVSQMHAGDSAASGLPGNPGGRWWKCTSWRARCCATCRRCAPCLVMHARNDDIASVSNAYEISAGPSTRPSRCNCWTTVIT